MTFLVDGMRGLGDNVFQRAFIKTLAAEAPVYLATPWPEIYDDLRDVYFVAAPTPLRTQAKNLRRQKPERWSQPPREVRRIAVRYGAQDFRRGNIVWAMRRCFGVEPGAWDLPEFAPPLTVDRPIAVLRPVTERREWYNSARNPLPEYVADVARDLMADHFVVSVADLLADAEWLVGDPPPAHLRLHAGELHVGELLGLIQQASVVVGGVGWIVPVCIATRTPLFVIQGGHGGHNAPSKITDSSMDLQHVGFAEPDHFCRCDSMRHACDKTNQRLGAQFREWRARVGV